MDFKKIIAYTLSLVTMASTIQTHAADIPPVLLKPYSTRKAFTQKLNRLKTKSKDLQKYIDEQKEKLEARGDGVILVNGVARKEIHPVVLAIFLTKINKFFDAYPNIHRKFIDMIKLCPDSGFILCCMLEEEPGTTSLYIDGFAHLQMQLSMNCYNNNHTPQQLVSKDRSRVQSHWYPNVEDTPYNLIGHTAAHEVGHLVHFLYMRYRFAKLQQKNYKILCRSPYLSDLYGGYKSGTVSLDYIKRELEPTLGDITPLLTAELDEAATNYRKYLEFAPKIDKAKILSFAPGCDEFISEYGKNSDMDWIAEVFSLFLCSDIFEKTDDPRELPEKCESVGAHPLVIAISKWLAEIEAEFAKG